MTKISEQTSNQHIKDIVISEIERAKAKTLNNDILYLATTQKQGKWRSEAEVLMTIEQSSLQLTPQAMLEGEKAKTTKLINALKGKISLPSLEEMENSLFSVRGNVDTMMTTLADQIKIIRKLSPDDPVRIECENHINEQATRFFTPHLDILRQSVAYSMINDLSNGIGSLKRFPANETQPHFAEKQQLDRLFDTKLAGIMKDVSIDQLLQFSYQSRNVKDGPSPDAQYKSNLVDQLKSAKCEYELKAAFITARKGIPSKAEENIWTKSLANDLKNYPFTQNDALTIAAAFTEGKEVNFEQCSPGLKEAIQPTLALRESLQQGGELKALQSTSRALKEAHGKFDRNVFQADTHYKSRTSGFMSIFRSNVKEADKQNSTYQREFYELTDALKAVANKEMNPQCKMALAEMADGILKDVYNQSVTHLSPIQKTDYQEKGVSRFQDLASKDIAKKQAESQTALPSTNFRELVQNQKATTKNMLNSSKR